ncbi:MULTISPECIES: ferredoxin [Actinosynnema]|uniref:ferredoxin n=1 Tax=Actinosynnema TaxID=40566 RepID=UPI0020A2A83E|nr:ferredoxin [Actinosynnema pretiosum]MCP2099903.1 Ferredoxin [Actinosynnema pretiosum]
MGDEGSTLVHVTTDSVRCVGAGQCAMISPEVFDQDDDGLVVVLQDRPAENLHDSVRQAADLCPARTIVLGATSA